MYQQQEINSSKPLSNIDAFNVLKVVAMIGMPFVHILENYRSIDLLSEECYRFTDFVFALTVFGPPIFMFCMGLGMAKDTSSKRLFKTGVQMLIISILFNIIRMTIPGLAAVAVGEASWVDLFCLTISSDIYSFVGIFYIFYSIIIKLKPSATKLLLISIIMLSLNIVVSSFCYGEATILTTFISHLLSISCYSYFPLMGWAIYPCLGIFTAKKLLILPKKKINNVFVFSGLFGIALLLITASSLKISIIDTLSEFAYLSYFHWEHAGLIMSITLITLSISYFIYQLVKNNSFVKKIASFGPLLMPFYIFQWLFTSLATAYYPAVYFILTGIHICITTFEFLLIATIATIICVILAYKKGLTFTRWLFKISDYTRWGKKQTKA